MYACAEPAARATPRFCWLLRMRGRGPHPRFRPGGTCAHAQTQLAVRASEVRRRHSRGGEGDELVSNPSSLRAPVFGFLLLRVSRRSLGAAAVVSGAGAGGS